MWLDEEFDQVRRLARVIDDLPPSLRMKITLYNKHDSGADVPVIDDVFIADELSSELRLVLEYARNWMGVVATLREACQKESQIL